MILVGITTLNLRGIADSARAFMIPTIVFVASIFTVIVAGLLRSEPASTVGGGVVPGHAQTIGIVLLLKAFSSGCAALTGVEAIANAVPSFKTPRVVNAQRAEVALGVLLGTMLIGLAVLIEKFSLAPVPGTTVLSQLTAASLGDGVGYYVVQFATVVLLALAANTSYGGLPTLMRILADDNDPSAASTGARCVRATSRRCGGRQGSVNERRIRLGVTLTLLCTPRRGAEG